MRSGHATIPEPARSFGRGGSASRPAGGFRRSVGRELHRFVAGHGHGGTGRARWCERGSRRLPSHLPVSCRSADRGCGRSSASSRDADRRRGFRSRTDRGQGRARPAPARGRSWSRRIRRACPPPSRLRRRQIRCRRSMRCPPGWRGHRPGKSRRAGGPRPADPPRRARRRSRPRSARRCPRSTPRRRRRHIHRPRGRDGCGSSASWQANPAPAWTEGRKGFRARSSSSPAASKGQRP